MNTALAQLRAKTDRELATLIRKEVERAHVDVTRSNFSYAGKRLERAERWLAVAGLSSAEHSRLERSIRSIRASIQVPEPACA